jgi:probable F420-dependent oxidoreductase
MVDDAQDHGRHADALRERLGPIGVWLSTIGIEPASVERDFAARVEALGYGALWFGEAPRNKEAFAHAAILLDATRRMTIATGIANIWVRDAAAMFAGAAALGEAYDERFLLGLGVSHRPLVDSRGHEYGKPLTAMRTYLDAMDRAPYGGALPRGGVPRVLAALRPRMLELSRDRAAGAHPYLVPVEHTAKARKALGPRPFLAPEIAIVVESDPARARAAGRNYVKYYLGLPNYTNNLRDLGYTDEDLAGEGSDRLVDALVAWGPVANVAARVHEHLDAGADHVCMQPLAPSVEEALGQLAAMAPALGVTPVA